MGRIGLPELIVILVIVIVIFGANRLPQLGAGIGSAIKNFKNAVGPADEPGSPPKGGACANCGTVNPADASFCRKCGTPLGSNEPSASPKLGACASCGTVNAADSSFCSKCGKPL
jgi:sec-independent protein translocase protein TatA